MKDSVKMIAGFIVWSCIMVIVVLAFTAAMIKAGAVVGANGLQYLDKDCHHSCPHGGEFFVTQGCVCDPKPVKLENKDDQ